MSDIAVLGGIKALVCAPDGAPIASDRDASDLLSESFSSEAILIVVPAERLGEEFFRLRTGMAGAFIQKLMNYRRRLAVVGDVSRWIEQSEAFRDFVYEANKGRDVWFVADLAQLEARLSNAITT